MKTILIIAFLVYSPDKAIWAQESSATQETHGRQKDAGPAPSETVDTVYPQVEAYADNNAGYAGFSIGNLWDAYTLGFRTGAIRGGPMSWSPFTAAIVAGEYAGENLTLKGQATFGGASMNLSKNDPAAPLQFGRSLMTAGLGLNGSYLSRVAKDIVLGPYLGADLFWAFQDTATDGIGGGSDKMPSQNPIEFNAGIAAGSDISANTRLKGITGVNFDVTNADNFRNRTPSGMPNKSVTVQNLSANVAVEQKFGDSTLTAGAQGNIGLNQPYTNLRPYVAYSDPNIGVAGAGHFQWSRDAFAPNEQGGGLRTSLNVADWFIVGSWAGAKRVSFPGASADTDRIAFETGLSFSGQWEHKERAKTIRMETRTRSEGKSSQAPGQDPWALNEKVWNFAKSSEFNNMFYQVLEISKDHDEFVGALSRGCEGIMPGRQSLCVLAVAATLTRYAMKNNYNHKENDGVLNTNSVDEIFDSWSLSYQDGAQRPVLVCTGAAQLAVKTANMMGEIMGIPIEARAVSVFGTEVGHSVPVIRTQEHGLVIVDWGRILQPPQKTADPKEIAAWYQKNNGSPSIHHDLRCKDGSHCYYFSSEEGRVINQALNFHNLPQNPQNAIWNDFDDQRGMRAVESVEDDLDRQLNR